MSATLLVLAVSTGVVVIVIVIAIVLVVLFVTASMRGRQKRGAEERSEVRRDVNEAEERGRRAERERDIAPQGGEGRDPDP
jgi:membrane protein implicated in regulation of membrane protease activity